MGTTVGSRKTMKYSREYRGLMLASRKAGTAFERILFEHYGFERLRRIV
jgi:hypothetical protein